jgi:hypothetical protein
MRQPSKPCPFCGDINNIIVEKNILEIAKRPLIVWTCACDNNRCPASVSVDGRTRDEAIDNWERRAE